MAIMKIDTPRFIFVIAIKILYDYDGIGSLIKESGQDIIKRFTYNDFRQNTAAEVIRDSERSIQKNEYDAEGIRYAVVENGIRTSFVTNGWSNFTELDDGYNVIRRIIRGAGITASEEDGEYHYYHGNERGDIEYITDCSGRAVNHYEYDAFGAVTKSEEVIRNRYTYNGEAYDSVTGQYYLRARYYNPVVSRFTQEDIYRGDGLNLYAFCGNNAVMYVDPSGYITYSEKTVNMIRKIWMEKKIIRQNVSWFKEKNK